MSQKNKESDNSTLIAKDALQRLDKVQEKNRQAYEKKPHHFHFSQLVMILVLGVILVIMLLSLR